MPGGWVVNIENKITIVGCKDHASKWLEHDIPIFNFQYI